MIIKAYCDGGCRNNQQKENVGWWGVSVDYFDSCDTNSVSSWHMYGGELNTTNNRMELTSCIKALEILIENNRNNETCHVSIIMDSQYVVAAFNENWIKGWIKRDWKKSNKKPVENQDLWRHLISLTGQFKSLTFVKVKGHSGHEGNEKADNLANKAMDVLTDGKTQYCIFVSEGMK